MDKETALDLARQLKVDVSSASPNADGEDICDLILDAGFVIHFDKKTGEWFAVNSCDQERARAA